jgi:hypothetical protein
LLVVVAEPVVVAIVDEAGFFPCLGTIITRMTHIAANLARHVLAGSTLDPVIEGLN